MRPTELSMAVAAACGRIRWWSRPWHAAWVSLGWPDPWSYQRRVQELWERKQRAR